MLIFAIPIVASAEETDVSTSETEIVTESEISAPEKTVTERIVNYAKAHLEEIIVILVTIAYAIIESRIRAKTNGSIGTLNNNAIAIANNSSTTINTALEKMESMTIAVMSYKDEMASMLDEVRYSEEEKKALMSALTKVEKFLEQAKLANIEFANELAELLCLANIPNSKKDELYKKHIEGVQKLEAEEVKSDDGTET
jgi:hypothetical protein